MYMHNMQYALNKSNIGIHCYIKLQNLYQFKNQKKIK